MLNTIIKFHFQSRRIVVSERLLDERMNRTIREPLAGLRSTRLKDEATDNEEARASIAVM